MTTFNRTTTLPRDPQLIDAISIVGLHATYADQAYVIHSVEGPTWYVFDQDGQTTIDTYMTPVKLTEPCTMLFPVDGGPTMEVPRSWVTVGHCLVKSWV